MNEFRLLDIKDNEIVEDRVYIGQDGILYKYVDSEFGSQIDFIKPLDQYNYIVMEYTGFKDSYNNKIYHGDIVHWKNTFKDFSTGETEMLDDIYYIFRHESGLWCMSDIQNVLHGENESVKVLGNIYQNPELLKHLEAGY